MTRLLKQTTPLAARIYFPADGDSIRPTPLFSLQALGAGPNEIIRAAGNLLLKNAGYPRYAFTASAIAVSRNPITSPLNGLAGITLVSVAHGENIAPREIEPANVYVPHKKDGEIQVPYSDPWFTFLCWITSAGATDADYLEIPQAGYNDFRLMIFD